MDSIKIIKKDAVHLKIECSDSIAKELHDYFTFKAPDAEFSPLFKKRLWDGFIRLFNLRQHTIYVGLYPHILNFCKHSGYIIATDSWHPVANEFSIVEAKEFVNSLNIHSHNQKLDIRDYQLASFIYGVRDKRLMLESPTSSGKSVIQYLWFRYFTEKLGLKKGLLIVPTTSLVEQMYTDFQDYSTYNGYRVHEHCQRIYEGHDKNVTKQLAISTWQSIYKLKEYFHQFEFILGDEAHLFKNDSLKKIMTNAVNAEYRCGVTGTLDNSETHRLVLEGHFGRKRKLVTTRELMDQGHVADLKIKVLFLKYPDSIASKYHNVDYIQETDFLLGHTARNNFIKNLALSLNGNTMLLFQYVEKHGKPLMELIQEAAQGRKVFFVYGGVDTEDREKIRAIVESETDAIIIASYGTFSTGINIKRLHNIILTHGTKSKIRVLQSIGRSLRLADDKDFATLFDIVDDMQYGVSQNYSLKHFEERLNYYISEKFDYKFYTINLKGEINA